MSSRLEGALRSPTFTITNRFIHVRAAGRDSRLNVVIRNFNLIRNPIYGDLKRGLDSETPVWLSVDVSRWRGERAYLEFIDQSVPDPADNHQAKGYPSDGFLAVFRVAFSDEAQAPHEAPSIPWAEFWGAEPPTDLETLALRYRRACGQAIRVWGLGGRQGEEISSAQLALIDTLLKHELLAPITKSPDKEIVRLLAEYRAVEASIRQPAYVPAMADGNGLDENVFIRGNPRMVGERVPRRFLEALGGGNGSPFGVGSGRLEFARRLTERSNPFTARVMVNRVWLHLFGPGIVPTPDDFGVLGQLPTHPELLDWLAEYFRTEGEWSVKNLIRMLVTSSA